MKLSNFLTGAVLAVLATGAAHAQVLSDTTGASPPVKAAVEAFEAQVGQARASGERLTYEQAQAIAREAMGDLDIGAVGLKDLEILAESPLLELSGSVDLARKRLVTFASEASVDGAVASILLLSMTDPRSTSEEERANLVRGALGHEGLGAALAAGRGGQIFGALGDLPPDLMEEVFGEIVELSQHMTSDLPPSVVAELPNMLTGMLELEGERYVEGREIIRKRMVDVVREAHDTVPDPGFKEYLASRLMFLEGAYARGQLVGYRSPRLDFTWSNREGGLTSLDDLKGKVVILDFWATWCGPCVASFPRVNELVERYKGHNVEVVGVTSLQGSHYGADGSQTDTEGNADLEYDLMNKYIPKKNIGWTIAFTKQEVFNPEFGIQGIPHVVILDTEGKVRYRGLHPMEPGKEEKIDGLLLEAGMAVPNAAIPASSGR